jgi:hypothetical protein
VWRVVAATGLAVAGLTSLGYAGWLVTARRAVFAQIASAAAADSRTVSTSAARSSDAADSAWWWATWVLLLLALGLWYAARTVTAERTGAVGFAAAALVGVGLGVYVLGALIGASVGGDPAAAERAVTGSVVVGAGLLLVGAGLFTGALSVLRVRPPLPLGYAGWNTG